MSYDPDEFDNRRERYAELDKLLAKLQDCDLSQWDQDFVDDMVKRLTKFKERTTVTAKQWEQLERMKSQYGCS